MERPTGADVAFTKSTSMFSWEGYMVVFQRHIDAIAETKRVIQKDNHNRDAHVVKNPDRIRGW